MNGRRGSPMLGIRARFLLAFLAIAALALGTALTAMIALRDLGGVLVRLSDESMPAVIASQQLSRQAERVSAIAPSLLSVQGRAAHAQQSERLASEIAHLSALFENVTDSIGDTAFGQEIDGIMGELGDLLQDLDSVVLELLELREDKRQQLAMLDAERIAAERLLTPGLLVLDAELQRFMGTSASAETPQLIAELHTHEKARYEISVISNTLLRAADARASDLPVLSFPLERALDNLESFAAGMQPSLRRRMLVQVRAFRDLAEGPGSILDRRGREVALVERAQLLLARAADASLRLSTSIDRLVSDALSEMTTVSVDAQEATLQNQRLVIGAAVATVALAVLIVWLYVGRGLVARMMRLSASMRAIADGDLDTPIPPPRRDELGDMSRALAVFRETAAEMRRTNLKEISEARRRLTDAIESLADGFTLFDANDRLVAFNTIYRDGLFPELSDLIRPGTTFEALTRAAAERGVIRRVDDDVEAWIAGRLRQHAEPGPPLVFELHDGRWIRLDEQPTREGGRVAIYTDITESKRREDALSDKTRELEMLSSQLSKYLSPQVYAAIFENPARVRVASERKKLTVFFSDIAGFAETADRLQPEEVAAFINQYLTEMSRIAIKHGGTIDKYMGDGMMIFFGDPESRGEVQDAVACVRMALDMQRTIPDLRETWRQQGIDRPPLVRMGIHSGFCTVGNFGSPDRMDYTIIGAGANAASRLETAAEPGTILISNPTYMHVRNDIICDEVGEIPVKGFAYPIRTYRVLGERADAWGAPEHFGAEEPHLRLDLEPDEMSPEERRRARDALRRGLDLLDD